MVEVQICLEVGCTSQVALYTLTVTYVVNDTMTASGANGYAMTAFPVPQTQTLAGNDQQSTLFLGIAADAASHALNVATLDPTSGALSYSVQALGDNVVLAGDGASLYAWPTTEFGDSMATITQVSLGTLTPGALALTLPGVRGVAPAPGAPQTLGVIYVGFSTVQIFDGTTGGPNTLGSVTGSSRRRPLLTCAPLRTGLAS
jgi:hypothetical protein